MRLALLLACLVVVGTGCQLEPTFTVEYTPQGRDGRQTGMMLTVREFADGRAPVRNPPTAKVFLSYVPILPWVDMSVHRVDTVVAELDEKIAGKAAFSVVVPRVPDAGEEVDIVYPKTMARAVARDLESSESFSAVRVVAREAQVEDGLVLEGTLHETTYHNYISSYGLGMVGVLLWWLPIPIGKKGGVLEMELVLRDAESGRVIWSERVRGEEKRRFSLYTSSAMIYGRKGAFSFQVMQGDERLGVDPYSMFAWDFAALRNAMLSARSRILDAAAQHAQGVANGS
jgi:hypothetical protein